MPVPHRLDPLSPTARTIYVHFDLEDGQNRVEVDIGRLHPSVALTILERAVNVTEDVADDLDNAIVLHRDEVLDKEAYELDD